MPGCGAALTQSGDVGAPSCPQSSPHPGVSDAPGVTLGIGPYPSSSPVVTATVSVGARVVQNEAALGQPRCSVKKQFWGRRLVKEAG